MNEEEQKLLQKEYDSLKRRYASLGEAVAKLEERIRLLLEEKAQTIALTAACETNLMIQKTIVTNTITSNAERQQADAVDIEILKGEIRVLKEELGK
jgi:hypothetical protein